jgi:membrane-bound lytic murein transglycosylase B
MKHFSIFLLIVSTIFSFETKADEFISYQDRPEVIDFIEMMHNKHGSDKQELKELFSSVNFQERVVRIMNRQPEGTMTWSSYKNMMVTDERVDSGKQFIGVYKEDLKRAEDIYGVPASIIASIIGIETRYGKIMGNIRVLDSLSTLSFDYPRRAKFFKVQLEEFLLLAEEENWDPSNIKGSIAGAMGFGQFMPDSYRNYAVDFDFDGKRDILNNPVDAIGSVANFLSKKGKWEPNTKIVLKATHSGERPKLKSSFNPYMKVSDLKTFGITPVEKLQNQLRVIPIELEIEKGYEYWIGLKNYQAISRYNRSKLYIMAVYEFSESLAEFF